MIEIRAIDLREYRPDGIRYSPLIKKYSSRMEIDLRDLRFAFYVSDQTIYQLFLIMRRIYGCWYMQG